MKKLFVLLGVFAMAGCQMNGLTNEPKSLTEKVSLLDKKVREQTGKIETLEYQNKKLREQFELFQKESRLQKTQPAVVPTSFKTPATSIPTGKPTRLIQP